MSRMIDTASDDVPTRRNWASFWSLLTLQTQNGFNDKAAQFLLIPMAGALVFQAKAQGQDVGFLGENMAHVLGALIVLPFILFAPLSGWVSDRFSKTLVIRGALCMQLAVLALIVVAVGMKSLPLAVLGFFLLSVESVLLSPAKKGIVKELVGHSRLGFASGVLEMSVILAVCFGQIVSGWWYDARREAGYEIWDAAYSPMTIIAVAAVLSLLLSFGVERVKPMGHRPFSIGVPFEHFGQLKELWEDRRIRLSGVGIAFFWGFAGFINLAAIQIGSELHGGGGIGTGSENSWLMLAASGGIAIGGVIASLLCKKKIELGLVPVGGFVMVLGSLALALGPIERSWLMTWMAIAGGGGALLLVPLNAYLQDICHPEKRGRVLAGLNLLDCMAGLIAVMIQFAMVHWKVPYGFQFGFLAVLSLWVTCYSARLLPEQFVKFVLLSMFRSIYRVRTINAERVPESGGVLLTPNHVSYVDGFILSVACPRPIRFLLFDEYFSHPIIGRFVRLFGAIPISPTRAKDGLRLAAKALDEGQVVCIFPEGQLTRSGGMNAFMRGFEMIARRADCLVLPAAMDGVWGSIFSFERNKFVYKKPYTLQYGVTVNFGDVLPAREADAVTLRRKIEALRAEAFALRSVFDKLADLLNQDVVLPAGDPVGYQGRLKEVRALPEGTQRELLANAMQMGELNAIQRGSIIMVDWDALFDVRDVVAIVYAQYYNLKVVLVSCTHNASDICSLAAEHQVSHFVGGKDLAEVWSGNDLGGVCYDFSMDAVGRVSDELKMPVFPCFTVRDRVVTMSIPHPPTQTSINDVQDGYRAGTWGRVLPGFRVKCDDSGVSLSGVSVGSKEIDIPGASLDGDGMLRTK